MTRYCLRRPSSKLLLRSALYVLNAAINRKRAETPIPMETVGISARIDRTPRRIAPLMNKSRLNDTMNLVFIFYDLSGLATPA